MIGQAVCQYVLASFVSMENNNIKQINNIICNYGMENNG